MLYTPGKLIYFDPFYFRNGSASKPKYFLVLKVIANEVILASLPSSKMHLPAYQEIVYGCLDMPEACINCYIFKAKNPVTKDGWSFDFDTFLYGEWLDDFSIEQLESNYPLENIDYSIVGELLNNELSDIIQCFSNSARVKRKYKRMLSN